METDTEITVNESDDPAPSICRCCLADGCYKDISAEYFWMGKREVYADMLNEAFNITIPYSKSGDSHSNARLICEQCITRLRDAADFKQQIIQSEKTFNEHLDTTLSEISMELELVEDEKPLVKKEKKDIDESDDAIDFPDFSPDNNDDDDNEDDADNMPLMKIASKTPKQESIETITIKSTTSPKVVKKRPVTSSLVPPPIKRLKLPTTSKEPARNIVTIKKVVGAPLNQKTQQSLFVRKVMGKPPPTLTKMSRTLPGPSTKILGRLPSNAKKLIKQGTSINVVRQIVGGGKTIMRQAGGTQLVIKPQAPKKVSASTEKPSTSDAKAPVKKEVESNNTRYNAEIIIKSTTTYPFKVPDDHMVCVYCGYRVSVPTQFREHMKTNHPTVQFKGKSSFLNAGDGNIKVDISDLHCRICPESFETLDAAALHLREVHKQAINLNCSLGLQPYKFLSDSFICSVCSQKCYTLRSLSRHTQTHFSKYPCEMCGRLYSTSHNLKKHVDSSHDPKETTCIRCKTSFSTPEAKLRHMAKSICRRKHVCNICGERFSQWEMKHKHMSKFHKDFQKPHVCPECNRTFTDKVQLLKHFKENHDDKNLCRLCGKRFRDGKHLRDHMVVHTKEKRFECNVCKKLFPRLKSLSQHMIMHSEDKKFVCQVCGKKFNQRVSLKSHVASYHRELDDLKANST